MNQILAIFLNQKIHINILPYFECFKMIKSTVFPNFTFQEIETPITNTTNTNTNNNLTWILLK